MGSRFASFESTMLWSIAIMALDGEIFPAISFQESTSDIASTYRFGAGLVGLSALRLGF